MMRFFTTICAVAFFATQAMAKFNVTVGHQVVLAEEMLTPTLQPNAAGNNNCIDTCRSADTAIKGCQDNGSCICNKTDQVLNCEQCLFTALLTQNIRPSDPLVGSQALLSALVTACGANPINQTLKLALNLTDNWDGPQSFQLNMAQTVVAVAFGAILSIGSFVILWNID